METADVLREKVAQIEKLWADIGKIVMFDSDADIARLDRNINDLRKAIENGKF